MRQRVAQGCLSTGELLARAGAPVSLRTFHHWVAKGAIRPAEAGNGSGSWHQWAPDDVQRLKRLGRWARASDSPLTLAMVRQLWEADPALPLRIESEGVLIYLPDEH